MKENSCNVVILTGNSLSKSGVGSFFINDLIALVPEYDFTVEEVPAFLMSNSGGFSFFNKLKSAFFVKSKLAQSVRLNFFIIFILNWLVKKIECSYTNNKASFFWLIASSPELILVGKVLASKGYDVRVTVWDDPEYLAKNLNLSDNLISVLLENFKILLKNSCKGMVISSNMSRKYKDKYNFNSEVIRHGISEVFNSNNNVVDTVKVVFAGSLYSKKEWNCFVDALTSADWKIKDKKIELYHIGDFPLFGVVESKNIIFLGKKTFNETMDILSSMHVGYLPYWFSSEYKIAAETSFPGKMSAYACAGLAVFHHAPSYTEVTDFLIRYPFGVCCNSLSNAEIIEKMSIIINDLNSPEYIESRKSAIDYELSDKANLKKINRFLGFYIPKV